MTGPRVAKEWVMVTLEIWSLPPCELRIRVAGSLHARRIWRLDPDLLSFFFGDMDLVARPGSVYTFWWSFRTHSRLPFLSREIFLSSGLEVILRLLIVFWVEEVESMEARGKCGFYPTTGTSKSYQGLSDFIFSNSGSIESLQSLIYGEHSSRWLEQGASRSRRPQGPFTYFHQRNYVFHLWSLCISPCTLKGGRAMSDAGKGWWSITQGSFRDLIWTQPTRTK